MEKHAGAPQQVLADPPVWPRLVTPAFLGLGCAALAYFFADAVLIPTVPLYVSGPSQPATFRWGSRWARSAFPRSCCGRGRGRLADRRGRVVLMIAGAAFFAVSVTGLHAFRGGPHRAAGAHRRG